MPKILIGFILQALLVGNFSTFAAEPTGRTEYVGIDQRDWPWWRGPQRDGVVHSPQQLPLKWSETENIAWSTPVPGKGHGSITVVGDRMYLATADKSTETQAVLCLDRLSGKILWNSSIHVGGFTDKGNKKSSLASSTVACDGQRLIVNFLNNAAVYATALDLDGHRLWQTKVADFQIHQGFGASPTIFGSQVIISADSRSGGAIVSLERTTGKEIWRHSRPALANYTSPVILNASERDQVLLTGCDLVTSLDPSNGKVLWEIPGSTTECVTSTVTDGKLIFTSGGYPKNHLAAVAADGSGKIVWENATRVYVPSMLIRQGHLFAVLDEGIVKCWDSASGTERWKARLGGTFSASPVMIGDNIIAVNEAGQWFVFEANASEFKLLAQNQLGQEVYATPAIAYDHIYARVAKYDGQERKESIVCIGNK